MDKGERQRKGNTFFFCFVFSVSASIRLLKSSRFDSLGGFLPKKPLIVVPNLPTRNMFGCVCTQEESEGATPHRVCVCGLQEIGIKRKRLFAPCAKHLGSHCVEKSPSLANKKESYPTISSRNAHRAFVYTSLPRFREDAAPTLHALHQRLALFGPTLPLLNFSPNM